MDEQKPNDDIIAEVVGNITQNVVNDAQEKTNNVIQDYETFSKLDKEPQGVALSLPSDTADNITIALSNLPNINIEETQDGAEWVNRIKNARAATQYRQVFDRTVVRENSLFKQAIPSEKGLLGASGLKMSDNTGNKLTGERAVLRVRALCGLGSVVNIPLWHSGFWVTIKAPSDSAMLELNRRLDEEKIQLGRLTWGLAFANNSVFFAGWLTDFALAHVYDTTLKPELTDSIRSRISQLDIPLLIWGIACATWPNGFPYARAVLDQTNGQNKVISEKVNVSKLCWTDMNSLTPWQISHMAQRFGSNMTDEMLTRYKNEFTSGKGRTIELHEGLSINLRVPTLDQYLTSGQKWVNNIVAMVDKAFGMQAGESARDSYIKDHGRATNMRQYVHFIESIDAAGDVITDQDTIDQTIDVLSSDDGIRDKFFKEVIKFIEDSTISLIAIPVTENETKSDLPRFPNLIPIDVMSVFFILLVRQIMEIQNRE